MTRPAVRRIDGKPYVSLDELIEMYQEARRDAARREDFAEADRLRWIITDLRTLI